MINNTNRIKKTVTFSKALGLTGPFEHSRPYPCEDHCGYKVALDILIYSRRPGGNTKDHVQFDTIKQTKACYSS